jgi:hypothetical protein
MMTCPKLSENVKSLLFWILSLASYIIMIASVVSNESTRWMSLSITGGAAYYGLWKVYACNSAGNCATSSYPDSDCKTYGQAAGTMLIFAIIITSILFIVKLTTFMIKDNKRAVLTLKTFYVLKTISSFSLPIVAIAIWTQKCYSPYSKVFTQAVWSVGPGILILALIFELLALVGITAAWRRSSSSST